MIIIEYVDIVFDISKMKNFLIELIIIKKIYFYFRKSFILKVKIVYINYIILMNK